MRERWPMFAGTWSVGHFFWKASRPHGQYSNRHATQHSALEFPQVGPHVDGLVLAVHFAQDEVLRAVGVNSEGSGHGAVLVGAGVAIRIISSSRTKGRRDLERSAAVCAWGCEWSQPCGARQRWSSLHRVEWVAKVFEVVVRPEDNRAALRSNDSTNSPPVSTSLRPARDRSD